jgi:hypothetical protein
MIEFSFLGQPKRGCVPNPIRIARHELPSYTELSSNKYHHRKIGFQEELRALLRKHEIEWDERYVWD